jgi:hypothetical protein
VTVCRDLLLAEVAGRVLIRVGMKKTISVFHVSDCHFGAIRNERRRCQCCQWVSLS